MKKILLLLACCCLIFSSCEGYMPMEEDPTEQEGNSGEEGSGEENNDDSENETPEDGEGGESGDGEGTGEEGGSEDGEGGSAGEGGGSEGGEGELPGGGEGEVPGGDDEGGSGSGTEDPDLVPDEKKMRLEKTGKKLLEMYPAESFAELDELSRYFGEKYLDRDYDWDAYWNRFDEIYEASYLEKKVPTGYDYEIILLLSQCAGTFTFAEDRLVYSPNPSNKTIVKMKDMNGKTCSATISQIGVQRDIYVGHYWDDYSSSAGGVKTDNFYVTVRVPERITAEIVLGSGKFAEASFDYVFDFCPDGIDITTDNLTVRSRVKISDTEVNVQKVHCNASSGKVEFSCNVKKGGRHLMSASGSGTGKIRVVTETSESGVRTQWVELLSLTSLSLEVDVLGEVQLKGTCQDAYALYNLYEKSMLNTMNQTREWTEIVDKMNSLFSVYMYYDKTSELQATLELEPDIWWREWENPRLYYYDVLPVICYPDGSKYSIEDYFTEDAFSTIYKNTEDFINSYFEMFEW